MVKTFDCAKCGGNHARPINRNCKEARSSAMESEEATNSLILKELKNLSSRMSQMEDKVVSLEGNRSPSGTSNGRSPASSISSRGHQEDQDEDLILPSLHSLRTSREIQDQVDARIRDLQTAPEKGKLKSQRGGSETVYVKREIPWPQNFILGGSTRTRVSYDSLSIGQWVSGFATIIKDEKDQKIKQNMLEYLSEIMEDSHDFGWGAAKGAHAVLLCKMEEGRLDWSDTIKIDRVRRAYAHKVQSHNPNAPGTKKNFGKDNPTPCKFFQKGTCSHKIDHEHNSHLYLHVCSFCFASGKKYPHALKDCKKNVKNE